MSLIKIIPTSQQDGTPNAGENCVPECINVAVGALTGVYRGANYYKVAAYGEAYRGPTAARDYVESVARLGVHMFAIDGSNVQLDQAIHAELAKYHPVVCTEPDWVSPQHPDWSHVVLCFEDFPGQIGAMDPWDAHIDLESDAAWEGKFEFHEVWSFEKMNTTPANWKDDGATLTAPNGHKVVRGFREYVLENNWESSNWPLEEEHGQAPLEQGNPGLGNGTQQVFRSTVLEWTPDRGVFEMWTGQEILALRAALKASQGQIPPSIKSALISAQHSAADFIASVQTLL